MLTWQNRPNNKVEYNLETKKILHELDLTEAQLCKALLYFFPDLYKPGGKWEGEISLERDVYQIKYIHTSYGPNKLDFIAKDMEAIRKILMKKGII